MNLLLDTHTFLWFCQDDSALSSAAKMLIEDAANRKLVSVASCWEIAIKAGLGKLKLGEPSALYLPNALVRTGFEVLSVTVAHAAGVNRCCFITATRSIGCLSLRHWPKDFPS